MEEQKDLPKPQTDLPKPELEITAHIESTNAKSRKRIDPKIFFVIFLGISGVIAFILGGIFLGKNPDVDVDQVACTMDAKICPDGSAVGRSGPKCEFAPCPSN